MVTFFFDVRKSTGKLVLIFMEFQTIGVTFKMLGSAIIVMFLMMGSLWITMLASTKEIQVRRSCVKCTSFPVILSV